MTRFRPMRAGTYTVASGFGPRRGGFHYGLDFAAGDGTPIYAAQAGTVVHIGAADGFGQWIVIDHPAADGGGTTVYGHMWDAFATGLKQGQRVEAGQLVGYVGSNGKSTGPHLHFEVHPTVWRAGSQINPAPWLATALDPATIAATPGGTVLPSPFNKTMLSTNRYRPRGLPYPRWIAIHTQEGGRTAVGLADFTDNASAQVAYHAVVDDHDIIRTVNDEDAPWSAAGANKYAFHVCGAGTYAGWSRGKWLETDARDGKNEDAELTNIARVVAYWCSKYGIPAVWIGDRNVPPWGLDGICGHKDFGRWGGNHHDPGPQFPEDELIRRVQGLLATGAPPPPRPAPPPIPAPGTNPDKYAGVLLYRGRPQNDPEQVKAVQRRLRDAYRAYAGHLEVDGDYGPMTEEAVREFQRRSGLVADGIVGPMTAAALKAW